MITVLINIESNTTNKQSSNHARTFSIVSAAPIYIVKVVLEQHKNKRLLIALYFIFLQPYIFKGRRRYKKT